MVLSELPNRAFRRLADQRLQPGWVLKAGNIESRAFGAPLRGFGASDWCSAPLPAAIAAMLGLRRAPHKKKPRGCPGALKSVVLGGNINIWGRTVRRD